MHAAFEASTGGGGGYREGGGGKEGGGEYGLALRLTNILRSNWEMEKCLDALKTL